MWDATAALAVDEEARRTLRGWVNARRSPQRMVMRARIILLAAEGAAARGLRRVALTTAHSLAELMRRGHPLRARLFSPATPCAWKRRRHKHTVG